MPTVFDKKFRALAKKLIKKFGIRTGQYTKVTSGVIDDDTNSVVNTVQEETIQMTPPLGYSQEDIALGTIQADDFRIFISGPDWDDLFTVQPHVNDFITLPSGLYRIIKIDPIYSGEQVAAYKFQTRKGNAL